MSGGPTLGARVQWSLQKNIAATDGTTVLKAQPGSGKQYVVQEINYIITTAAAQAFTIGDGTTNLVSAPASQAVNWYGLDWGELGIPLAANTAISYTATAGVALMIAAYGYILDAAGG